MMINFAFQCLFFTNEKLKKFLNLIFYCVIRVIIYLRIIFNEIKFTVKPNPIKSFIIFRVLFRSMKL